MPRIAIVIGLLLVLVGVVGYASPKTIAPDDNPNISPTALIPAGVGAILVVCGLAVVVKPTLRKHVMHVAATVGLLGAVGGIMPLTRAGLAFEKASVRSGILMIALCTLFVILCVRSFVLARVARAEGLPPME